MESENSYSKRLDQLEAEIIKLDDLLLTLVSCVSYRDDKPYDAKISRLMLTGQDRVELLLLLNGITNRLKGKPNPNKPRLLFDDNPHLVQAYLDEPMTTEEAIELLSHVVGIGNAAEVLDAFKHQFQTDTK